MKYIGELSLAWLFILAFYAVVQADARALEGDTFISDREVGEDLPAEDEEKGIDENMSINEEELFAIIKMALQSYLGEKQGASSLWFRPMDPITNGFTGNYKRSQANSAIARDYARAAMKRNMRDELRNELVKKGYRSPVDMSGGSLIGKGYYTGVGR